MKRSITRSLFVVTTLIVSSCEPPSSALRLPASVRTTELSPERQALLRAELDVPGLLAPVTLTFNDSKDAVSGSFVVDVPEERVLNANLRVFGRFRADSDEVLLALATGQLTVRPRDSASLLFADDQWRTSGAAVFDQNGNGASNIDDLVDGVDPAAPGTVIEVSPRNLQFPSGVRPGELVRQIVVIENASELPQSITAEVTGAQGVSIVRVSATGTPETGAPRTLPPFTLQPFQEQLLAVTFAPTSTALVRGAITLRAEHEASGVTTLQEVDLVANSDGDPQNVDPTYDPGTLSVTDVPTAAGSAVERVLLYPPSLLFGGQPLTPGTPVTSTTGDNITINGLARARAHMGGAGIAISEVFLLQIPPRARLSAQLSGISDDVDLALVLLNATGTPDISTIQKSKNPGTSAEAVQHRNTTATAQRAILVVGRNDTRDPSAQDIDDGSVIPFSLLAQLNIGPELQNDEPIAPLTSPFRGGATVTIRGISFVDGAVVRFGQNAASRQNTSVSADGTTVTTVTPSASEADVGVPLTVVVQNPDGTAATHPPIFIYDAPAPIIDSVDPTSASESGGTPVVIRGAFFTANSRVIIGGATVTANNVTFVSASELHVTVPPRAPGLTTIIIENVEVGDAIPSVAFPFAYVQNVGAPPVIDDIAPRSGLVDGGEQVLITGSGFSPASTVRFGGAVAQAITFIDDTQLAVTTPSRALAGVVDVLILNPDGRFDVALDAFTYTAPAPALLNVTPATFTSGARLQLDGAGFRSGLTAAFIQDGLPFPATITVVSSVRALATVPIGLALGDVTLVVTNPDGQASAPVALMVIEPPAPAPRVIALSPSSIRAPQAVTVLGTDFNDAVTLTVDDVAIAVRDVTSTSITFDAPARATGTAIVRVTNPDGQSATGALQYEPPLVPVVFTASPDTVSVIAGDIVTVTGQNFDTVSAGQIRIEDGSGAVVASTVLSHTATLVRVQVGFTLAERDDYRVVVGAATSPTFAAIAPSFVSQQVINGLALADTPFQLLLSGQNLNRDHVQSVRLTLAQDVGGDIVVTATPALKSNTLIRVDVTLPAQGAWTVDVLYDNGLVVAVPGEVFVRGTCGNGVIDIEEECDLADLSGFDCTDVGFTQGTLRCLASCRYDTRQCNRCGDRIIDSDLGEDCDTDNVGLTVCADLIPSSTSGTPGCDSQCRFTAGTCATCGNGIREGDEQCDGNDFASATCSTLGFNAGALLCDSDCTFDSSQCSTCGNGRCDAFENNANCAADCPADCGNGVCAGDETCNSCPADCGGGCEAPFTIAIFSGDAQNGRPQENLTQPLVVELRAAGNDVPLTGVEVTFDAPVGGAVNPKKVFTDALGRASTQATMPRTIGTTTFTATGTGPDGEILQGAPLTITATVVDADQHIILNLANRAAAAVTLDMTNPATATAASKTSLRLDTSGNAASGVAVGADGAVFIAETTSHRVVKVTPAGQLFLYAGSGGTNVNNNQGFVDNVTATQGKLNAPRGAAVDGEGHLYIADFGNNRIRKVDAVTGIMSTIAGGGTSTDDGVLATTAQLFGPTALAFNQSGELFVFSTGTRSLKKITAENVISTIPISGDVNISCFTSSGFGFDPQGRAVFAQDTGCGFGRLLRIDTTTGVGTPFVSNENNTKSAAVVDAAGNVFFTDRQARRIRRFTVLNVNDVFAGGNGTAAAGTVADGGPAANALFNVPGAMAFGPNGDLYVVDVGLNQVRVIRAVGQAALPTVNVASTGSGQSAPLFGALAQPLTVTATAADGAPFSGITVTVDASTGAAAEPASGVTDANGVFSFVGYVGRQPGLATFTARVRALDGTLLATVPLTATAVDLNDNIITTLLNQRGTQGSGLSTSSARSFAAMNGANVGPQVSVDAAGNLYVADTQNNRVLRVTAAGAIDVVRTATTPRGVVTDDSGNIYIADTGARVVRVLKTDGSFTVFAGNGTNDAATDGIVATGSSLSGPQMLAIGPRDDLGQDIPGITGRLFIYDQGHGRLRKVEMVSPGVPGVMTSISLAASCTLGLRDGGGLAFDRKGRLYFIGFVSGGCSTFVPVGNQDYVVRAELDGTLTAIAGGGTVTATGPALGTSLNFANGLAVDPAGNLYIAENNAHRIRMVDVMGTMRTVIGDGTAGFTNDNAQASGARVNRPAGMTFDAAGNLYIVDSGNRAVRMVRGFAQQTPVEATMEIVEGDAQTTVMNQLPPLPIRVRILDENNTPIVNLPVRFTPLDLGDVVQQASVSTNVNGDASTIVRVGLSTTTPHRFLATAVTWLEPRELRNANGDPVVFTLQAQRPQSGAVVAVVNVAGTSGNSASNIASSSVRMNTSSQRPSMALAPDGTLFVSDTANHKVWSISPEGHAAVFAGTGTLGFIDNIEATQARLNAPRGLAVDAEGNVYIADGGNDRLRRVDLAGNITTIAGGAADSAGHGDGGAGSGVNFNNIQGIYTGPDDALYVVDSGHRNVRRVEKQNPFNTTTYMTGTGCVTTGVLAYLDIGSSGLTWDELGRAYFAATVQRNGVVCPLVDFNGQHALLRRELNGTLTYLSGTITNNATTNGDGQTGSETFWQPLTGDLFFDGDDLVFANGSDHRLRKITGVKDVVAGTTTGSTGTVTTIIGTRGSAGFSPLTLPGTELLNRPISLVRHPITGDIYIADTNNHSIRMLVP